MRRCRASAMMSQVDCRLRDRLAARARLQKQNVLAFFNRRLVRIRRDLDRAETAPCFRPTPFPPFRPIR